MFCRHFLPVAGEPGRTKSRKNRQGIDSPAGLYRREEQLFPAGRVEAASPDSAVKRSRATINPPRPGTSRWAPTRNDARMPRRLALALLALLLVALPAAAQTWPSRPVKLIVPFGAGSTPDFVMRLIADHLKDRLGQNFIVENKPGASGNLGTDAVAKAE